MCHETRQKNERLRRAKRAGSGRRSKWFFTDEPRTNDPGDRLQAGRRRFIARREPQTNLGRRPL